MQNFKQYPNNTLRTLNFEKLAQKDTTIGFSTIFFYKLDGLSKFNYLRERGIMHLNLRRVWAKTSPKKDRTLMNGGCSQCMLKCFSTAQQTDLQKQNTLIRSFSLTIIRWLLISLNKPVFNQSTNFWRVAGTW